MGANQGVTVSSIAWADYDNDGDLDIAVSGRDSSLNCHFIIYRNNGDGTLTNIAEPMGANQGVYLSSIAWADYDNDGDLDIAVSGRDSSTNKRFIIYRNNGDGTFTNIAEPMGADQGVYLSSIAWGDYDNDGDLDIAVSGQDSSGNYRFIIYQNNGDGTFTQVAEPMGANQGVFCSSIAWADYDNDGDLDIAVSGDTGSARRFIIYQNNGDGTFTNAAEPMGANQGVKYSSIAWGDYDNNGDLDIAVSGMDSSFNYRFIIYRNNGDGTFTQVAEPMGANQGVFCSSIAWADYDNDGDLDIAVSGQDGSFLRRFIIYRNIGADSFTNIAEPMGANQGVNWSSLAWGDYDNDGDLDIAVSGEDAVNKRFIIYRNDNNAIKVNERPSAPTLVSPDGNIYYKDLIDTITFTWTAATDDTTPINGLSYNIYIGKSSLRTSIVSADTDSNDSVTHNLLGNCNQGLSYYLWDTRLEVGETYYWSVQAIDAGQMVSQWATEKYFYVSPPYSGPIWYVSTTGSDSYNGSVTYPFRTITKAISRAAAGDTIYIAAGTYSETITIDKDNITIIGADSATTIIDPPGDSTNTSLYGIYADAKTNLHISNLRITDCYYGIYFNNVDTSVINNVWVEWCGKTGGSGAGITLINGSDSNIIQNCYVYKNIYGLFINNNSNKNTITNNLSSNNKYGFYFETADSNYIKNNTISNNEFGLYLYSSFSNNVISNKSINNDSGFYIDSSGTNYITNNTILNNKEGIIDKSSYNNYIV